MTDIELQTADDLGLITLEEGEALARMAEDAEDAQAAWEAYEEYLLDCQNETPRPL